MRAGNVGRIRPAARPAAGSPTKQRLGGPRRRRVRIAGRNSQFLAAAAQDAAAHDRLGNAAAVPAGSVAACQRGGRLLGCFSLVRDARTAALGR